MIKIGDRIMIHRYGAYEVTDIEGRLGQTWLYVPELPEMFRTEINGVLTNWIQADRVTLFVEEGTFDE